MEAVSSKVCSVEGCGKKHCAKGLCNSHWANQYYRKNIERKRAAKREWARKQGREWRRDRHYRDAFGISLERYNEILASQGGKCAIPGCGRTTSHSSRKNSEQLQVDHDHTTGKVRGLLCVPCNLALGHLRDSVEILEGAITYLKKNNGSN